MEHKITVPELWQKSIAKQTNVKEIILDLIQQIKKDFGMFGEEIDFSENTEESYHQLFIQLEAFLFKNYAQHSDKLYPVLYRIDISEKDIKNAMNHETNTNFIGNIAELIILKELQKVIIRRFYKTKNEA